MQEPIGSSHNQSRRAQIVVLALGSFTVLLCIFLILLDQEMRRSSEVSFVQPTLSQTPGLPPYTPSPFLPDEEATLVLGRQLESTNSRPAAATPTFTPTATVVPSATLVTLAPQSEGTAYPLYIVRAEDSLDGIALALNLSPEALRSANYMFGDAVLPGQSLIIPPPERAPEFRWQFASLDKLQANIFYPSGIDTERFRMHYVPNTYPAVDPLAVAGLLDKGLGFVEESFGQPVNFGFDVYVAGTIYEPPNTYLRGRSFSYERQVFFLHNGSGDAITQQYLATHELTHMYAWNMFGPPVSFLVSEGAAVYTGMKMIADSPYMPIQTFCAIFHRENRLPLLYTKTELRDFRGHNNNLLNYYASGCLVGYLIETYGTSRFGQLYYTQDYQGIYGQTLEQLEMEWKSSIDTGLIIGPVNTSRFINAVDVFMATNESFYYAFNGSWQYMEAYQALDKARLALLKGNLDDFDQHMLNYQAAMNQ